MGAFHPLPSSSPQDLPPGELVAALTGAFHPVASLRRDLAMELLHTMKVRNILLLSFWSFKRQLGL